LTDVLNTCRQRQDAALSALNYNTPAGQISKLESAMEHYSLRSAAAIRAKLELSRSGLAACSGRLSGLSPLSILQRGYAAVSKSESGISVRGVCQLL